MKGSNDSMMLRGADAPALGVEERSDEAPRAGGAVAPRAPDPEVVAKPTRRRFSAEYRLRILEEADRCTQPRRDRPSAASRGLVQFAFVRLAQGAPQRFAQGPDTEKTRRQAGRIQSL